MYKFSLGLRLGLFPGHSDIVNLTILRYSCPFFAWWHGASSCINILQTCIYACESLVYPATISDTFQNSCLFQDLENINQIICIGGCFILRMIYFSCVFHHITFLKVFWHNANAQQTDAVWGSSENIMFPYCFSVQYSCFFLNKKVKMAGLQDLLLKIIEQSAKQFHKSHLYPWKAGQLKLFYMNFSEMMKWWFWWYDYLYELFFWDFHFLLGWNKSHQLDTWWHLWELQFCYNLFELRFHTLNIPM